MKKSIYAVCAAVVAMFALSFASCSNDDEKIEEFQIAFEVKADTGSLQDPEAIAAIQNLKRQIEAQRISYIGTLSEAKAKFNDAVLAGGQLQSAINEMYNEFGVDVQVTLKMTNSDGEVVSSHLWKHQ